jgi:hypothetical protein
VAILGAETIGPAYTAGAAASRRVIAELYFMMLMKSCCRRWNGKGKTKKRGGRGVSMHNFLCHPGKVLAYIPTAAVLSRSVDHPAHTASFGAASGQLGLAKTIE